MNELHVIVVRQNVLHLYWRPGAYVALADNDWGPSPTLRMVDVPQVFLTVEEAQHVIDHFVHRDLLEVATFRRV